MLSGVLAPAPECDGASGTDGPIPEHEVASDRDVVHSLLSEGDSRMRQSAIVERTGWSKAKVSRLLGEMDEDGTIVKVQVGRENVIYREGAEPDILTPFGSEGGG